MKNVAAALLLVAGLSACASSPRAHEDADLPQAEPASPGSVIPPADVRIAQMQTAMTELLERIDVLNDRVQKLETALADRPATAAPAQPSATPAHRAAAMPPPSESISSAVAGAQVAERYREALMLFGRGRNAESRAAFQKVFDVDPTGELADNALYWIGETWLASGNSAEAIRFFKRVIAEYADQNKAPDAMFKLGVTYERTGDLALAKQTLEECIRKYPYSSAATSAKSELKRIQY